MKRPIIIAAALLLSTSAHAAEKSKTAPAPDYRSSIEMALGVLQNSGAGTSQSVQVTNNGTREVANVDIECGFFRDNALFTTARVSIQNLLPSTTGYGSAIVFSERADHAECRVIRANVK
jgi:hypothetical protein